MNVLCNRYGETTTLLYIAVMMIIRPALRLTLHAFFFGTQVDIGLVVNATPSDVQPYRASGENTTWPGWELNPRPSGY